MTVFQQTHHWLCHNSSLENRSQLITIHPTHLVPADFFLLPKLKIALKGQRLILCRNDSEDCNRCFEHNFKGRFRAHFQRLYKSSKIFIEKYGMCSETINNSFICKNVFLIVLVTEFFECTEYLRFKSTCALTLTMEVLTWRHVYIILPSCFIISFCSAFF